MSPSQTCRLAFSLALAVIRPAGAFAQTPTTPKAPPPQVQIRVSFLTASVVDVDSLGMKFDRVPFPLPAAKPPPGGAFLRCSTDSIVTQFYQALVRTRGTLVQEPVITTDSNVTATIRVDTQVSYPVPSPFTGGPEPVQRTRQFHLRAGLSITPRINGDGSVTLSLTPQIGEVNTAAIGPRAAILRTIPIGGMMVIAGLPLSDEKPTDGMELLMFVTPTPIGTNAPKPDRGQPEPAIAGKTISLDVSRGDLRTVVAMLERQANVKTSVVGTDKMYKPVYVHLDGTSVSKALRTIATSAGAQIIRDDNGVYVFSPLSGTAKTPILPDSTDGTLPVTSGSSVTVTP